MLKGKIVSTVLLVLTFYGILLSNPQVSIALNGGYGKTLSNKYPHRYDTFNLGLKFKKQNHLISCNCKSFSYQKKIATCEVSNEVTGKEFIGGSLKYGQLVLESKHFGVSIYSGLGMLIRKINREKSISDKSSKKNLIIVPLELCFLYHLNNNIDIKLKNFIDVNSKEFMGGFAINLQYFLFK